MKELQSKEWDENEREIRKERSKSRGSRVAGSDRPGARWRQVASDRSCAAFRRRPDWSKVFGKVGDRQWTSRDAVGMPFIGRPAPRNEQGPPPPRRRERAITMRVAFLLAWPSHLRGRVSPLLLDHAALHHVAITISTSRVIRYRPDTPLGYPESWILRLTVEQPSRLASSCSLFGEHDDL